MYQTCLYNKKEQQKSDLHLVAFSKKTVQMHLNDSRPNGTHGTRSNMMNSRAHTSDNSVHTCLAPTLPSPALSGGIPDSQPAALHARLHHIARLRTTHAHSVSIATTQEGRACKARNQSAHMHAGCVGVRECAGLLGCSAWAPGGAVAHLRPPCGTAANCTPPGRGCTLVSIPATGQGGPWNHLNRLSRVVLSLSRHMCTCI